MKKRSIRWLCMLLTAVMLLSQGGMTAFAEQMLVLPSALDRIETEAFSGDASLDRVVLPEGVRRIESRAFANTSLRRINLPDSLTYISSDAFDGTPDVRFIANSGSYGYNWAISNGYTVEQTALPESEHPYAANSELDWTYTHPTDVNGLDVTFSAETEFENGYDMLTITDSEGNELVYTGTELAGMTLSLPGSSFSLHLHSDDSINKYGFAITAITEHVPAILESEHPYANNSEQEWTYTHPTSAVSLKVTFSASTMFESGYDALIVTDSTGYETVYTGTELAGVTLWLPGNSFRLRLISDESYNYYGFAITKIVGLSTPVVNPVTGLTVDYSNLVMTRGQTQSLTAAVQPENATDKRINWSSSNTSVATVSSAGLVTAVNPGTATITAASAADPAITAACTVTVREESGKMYRAFLVGNNAYRGNELDGCINDMNAMSYMLSGLGNAFSISKKPDATASQITSGIASAFSGATENDVSLFYYSGHGMESDDSSYLGALAGVDYNFVKPADLAAALSQIPGRVIVVLDCCYSGSVIGRGSGRKTDVSFNQSVINAFAAYDTTINAAGGLVSNSGELAASKFIVFTACRSDQPSWERGGAGLFTYCFLNGCGVTHGSSTYNGSMPADVNTDNRLTVSELFDYTAEETAKRAEEMEVEQDVQCYAANMSEIVFYR